MNDNNATDDVEQMDETEALRLLIEQQVALIAGALMEFTSLSDEQLQKHAAHVASEQLQVAQQIIPTLTRGNEQMHNYPRIGVKLHAPNGQEIIAKAYKRPEGITDPGEAIHWAFVTALLFSPQIRAVLSAHGFTYAFVQMKAEEPKPKIIL